MASRKNVPRAGTLALSHSLVLCHLNSFLLGVQSSALFLLIKTGFFLGFWPPKIA